MKVYYVYIYRISKKKKNFSLNVIYLTLLLYFTFLTFALSYFTILTSALSHYAVGWS